MITVWIDELTPCLINAKTGKQVRTEVVKVTRPTILRKCTEDTGWFVNWSELCKKYDVYALVLAGEYDSVQGLVAMHDEPNLDASYIVWMVSAPQNDRLLAGNDQMYKGVGGHLFAIAGMYSGLHHHQGDAVYGFAANARVLRHYVNTLGAMYVGTLHRYHFILCDEAMRNIEEVYNFDISKHRLG